MNDRPDLARLSEADGVHVGQDELTVKDVRSIIGPGKLVGVSTHSIDQARQAVLDGASYLGVGPTGGATSGGWSRDFNLAADSIIQVSLQYRMLRGEGFESNEFGELVLEIDGTRYGSDTNNSLVHEVGQRVH